MNCCTRRLDYFLAAAIVIGIFLGLEYAPPMLGPNGEYLGESFRIFFFHVPAAWVSFLCFLASFVAGIGYLAKKSPRWDTVSAAAAETGFVFATIVLVTGPVWGRAAWGAWWTWEPRLTSFLILWLIYLGYLLVRSSIDDLEKRAKFSAALAIIGFLEVPIVMFSIKLWGAKSHPKPGPDFFGDPAFRLAIFWNLATFILLAFAFIRKRSFTVKTHD